MNYETSLLTLQASARRALTGEVFDELVALTCGLENQTIRLRAYFSGEISDKDMKQVQIIGTEIIADFPEGYMIEEEYFSIEETVPEVLDMWIYRK